MPNKFYIKGVVRERKIMNQARSEGKIAFRSAGSHSPIDVCVIDIRGLKVEFIQCKPDTMSESKKASLEKEMEALNNNFKCSFKVV